MSDNFWSCFFAWKLCFLIATAGLGSYFCIDLHHYPFQIVDQCWYYERKYVSTFDYRHEDKDRFFLKKISGILMWTGVLNNVIRYVLAENNLVG